MTIRPLLCLLPFALASCQAADESATGNGVVVSDADRSLIATGLAADQVAAARAYLVPFTKADQAACFDEAALGGATMQGGAVVSAPGPITRVVIAVDASGSMAARIGSRTKLELARDAARNFVAGLPPQVEAALLSFGQRGDNSQAGKAASCAGVDLLAPMARDRAGVNTAVADMKAVGWTPLAAGLERAEATLAASAVPGEQVIYVVSDGLETCGGDPVAVARRINTGATRAIVNIVGFGLPRGEAAALQRVAGAGGGSFVNVTDDAGYQRVLAGIRDSMRQAGNRIRAGVATADNTIRTGTAISKATMCTGGIVARETRQVALDLAKRDRDGPPNHVVWAVLKQRHDTFAARRDAYQARLTGARETANSTVEEKRAAAE